MKVYLDYAATAPVKKEVRDAMMPFLGENFGNPSSIHSWGQVARGAVDEAREKMAKFLNCRAEEIIFTSGGTEADNLAIRGIVFRLGLASRLQPPYPTYSAGSVLSRCQNLDKTNSASTGIALEASPTAGNHSIPLPHIVTTQIEHHAVLRTCQYLEKNKLAEVTYLKPNRDGLISVEQVKKAIKKNTVLVSVMYVNNEIGTLEPIREIGKMIEQINQLRIKNSKLKNPKIHHSTIHNSALDNSRIYFHTDAVQAAQYFPMDVDFLHVDLLTISGHKIGAPKGIGALYAKKNTPLEKILFGGEQEANRRAGTENVAGIVTLGQAAEVLRTENLELRTEKTTNLRDYFVKKVLKEIPDVELNGSKEFRSPNNANFYFKYIEGESILLSLDLVGIAASSGSACTSLSLSPSHVLMATYNNPERSHGSVRFTLGEETSKAEIDYTIKNLKIIIQRLRNISPLTKER